MERGGSFLNQYDARGVFPLLTIVAGLSAIERGADIIGPTDLVKAIYVVDIEHVQRYWDDWENFEAFVTGGHGAYINRALYLVQATQIDKDTDGVAMLGRPSTDFSELVAEARRLCANKDPARLLGSRELLYCACLRDGRLREALQSAGLDFDKLTCDVL